jgi:hypothetical protein
VATSGLLVGLIGHGTTGADGIPRGNHLRWAHDRRLGFPLGGYRVYRRVSAGWQPYIAKACIGWPDNRVYPRQFPLPDPAASHAPNLNDLLSCSERAAPVQVAPGPGGDCYLEVRGELQIDFPEMVDWASIEGYYDAGRGIELEAFAVSTDSIVRRMFHEIWMPLPQHAIRAAFTANGPFADVLIQRQEKGSYGWQPVRAWGPIGETAPGRYEWLDESVMPTSGYINRIKVRSAGGLISPFSPLLLINARS